MTRPDNSHLIKMAAFLTAVAALAAVLAPGLAQAFLANPALNGLILGVFAAGLLLNFRHVLLLRPEQAWLDGWRRGHPPLSSGGSSGGKIRLLAPLAGMLGDRRDRLSLSASAQRSVLDSIATRLEESRDLARYFIGLLIFLGLLGTFWGLSKTVGSIGQVIGSLSVAGPDAGLAFESLKRGLEAPLSGMGTAFSTSLFGLAGSLVLGFLDLQAGQAQNAFHNDIEEWLASQTRLGGGAGAADDQAMPAYIRALLEQTAENLDNLQRVIERGEEGRIATNASLRVLAEKMATLTDQMRAEQALMLKLGEGQVEAKPLLARLAMQAGIDDITRDHIRNLDTTLARLLDETVGGREALIAELRTEFKLLARTIAQAAD